MMDNPYKVVHLVTDEKRKIRSVAFYNEYLLVGTDNGHLMMFKMVPKSKDMSSFDVRFVRVNKAFAKGSVVQLAVVSQLQLVLSLADDVVRVHKIGQVHTSHVYTVEKSRGAEHFAYHHNKESKKVEGDSSKLRLCVLIQRKIMLFSLEEDCFGEILLDSKFPQEPKVVHLLHHSIIVGFKDKYSLVSMKCDFRDIIVTGKKKLPCIVSIENKDEVLVGLNVDNETLLFNEEGVFRSTVEHQWKKLPKVMVSDPCFLIALTSNSTIEVISTDGNLTGHNLIECEPVKDIVGSNGKYSKVILVSTEKVYCLVRKNVDCSKRRSLQKTQSQKSTESNTPGRMQMKLANLVLQARAVQCLSLGDYEKSFDLFLKCGAEPTGVAALFPEIVPPNYEHLILPCAPVQLTCSQKEDALKALIKYLLLWHYQLVKKRRRMGDQLDEETNTNEELNFLIECLKRCFELVNDEQLKSFVDSPETLTENLSVTLIPIYTYLGMHSEALEILSSMAEMGDMKSRKKLKKYLQKLNEDYIDLIFKYLPVMVAQGEEAMVVLTSNESLNRSSVAKYIESHHPDLMTEYLEHVIWRCEDTTTEIHNRLVAHYVQDIRKLCEQQTPGFEVQVRFLKTKLRNFLTSSVYYGETACEVIKQANLEDELGFALESKAKILKRDESIKDESEPKGLDQN